MKHAFLIGVYKNPEYVKELILSVLSDKTNVYVHINKNNYEEFLNVVDFFKDYSNVVFIHNIKVMWGGSTLLCSVKELIKMALENKDNQWFHLITGQDVLIKPLSDLIHFFENDTLHNYVGYAPLPSSELWRFNRYHLYDIIDVRSMRIYKILEFIIKKIPILFVYRKIMDFKTIYWGSSWWSMQRDAMEYVLERLENKYIENRLKHTFAPDEMIFQTLLLNSPKKFHVINDNLRFMVWNGMSGPRDLTINDFDDLKKTKAFFARKIDSVKDAELYRRIKQELNKTE